MRKLALAVTPLLASLVLAASAFAGGVDPNTLQPAPPNATCRDAGQQIVCDTFFEDFAVNRPNGDFELPCGTVYETSYYRGDGTRWYVDRLAVRLHVAASLVGTLSLSPTGAGPTVRTSAHWSIRNVWTTPGDDSTVSELRSSGSDLSLSAPGFGVIMHSTGPCAPRRHSSRALRTVPAHTRGRRDPLRGAYPLTTGTT